MNGGLSPYHLFSLAKTGIKTPADFRGKRFVIGLSGSPGLALWSKAVLKAYGMTLDDVKAATYSESAEMISALKEGVTDVCCSKGGVPYGRVTELAMFAPVSLAQMDEEHLAIALKEVPAYVKGIIPAGSYKGVDENILTGADAAQFMVRRDLPESFVYEMMKSVYEHLDEFHKLHPAAKEYTLENAVLAPLVPFHPGVIKYLKEKGVWTTQMEAKQQELLKTMGVPN